MSGHYFRVICEHPLKVLLASLLVLAAAAAGIPQLSLKSNLRVDSSPETPQDQMEETYTRVDNVVFVLAPGDGVFNQRVLTLIDDLTAKAWKIPFSSHVDSITNLQHSYAQGDDIIAAKSLSAEQVHYPDVQLYLSGIVMMDNAVAKAAENDMKILIPAMLVLALVIMGWIMGSVSASLAALLVLTFSIVATMGLAGWLGLLLNPVSINAPTIILTIATCGCVHLLTAYLVALRSGSTSHNNSCINSYINSYNNNHISSYNDKRVAMEQSLQSTIKPVLITSATTTIAFLSLNTSEAPPFRDLGNITALGVLAALFFTLTFLPALMMIIKIRVQPQSRSRIQNRLDNLAGEITHYPLRFALSSTAFVAIISLGLFNNTLSDKFVKYFNKSIEFRQHTDYTTQPLAGIYCIDYAAHHACEYNAKAVWNSCSMSHNANCLC